MDEPAKTGGMSGTKKKTMGSMDYYAPIYIPNLLTLPPVLALTCSMKRRTPDQQGHRNTNGGPQLVRKFIVGKLLLPANRRILYDPNMSIPELTIDINNL